MRAALCTCVCVHPCAYVSECTHVWALCVCVCGVGWDMGQEAGRVLSCTLCGPSHVNGAEAAGRLPWQLEPSP